MNRALLLIMTTTPFISPLTQMNVAMSESMVSVEPSHIKIAPGDIVTMNITVDPGNAEVMGAQYSLYFDSVVLNGTKQGKGGFLSQDGASTMEIVNEINNTIGIAKYGETRIGVDYGVFNPGVLATVTFKANEPGICSLNLSGVKLYDPEGVKIEPVLVCNGTCNIEISQAPTPASTSMTISRSGENGIRTASATPTQTPSLTPTLFPTITPVSPPPRSISQTTIDIPPIPTASAPLPAAEEQNRLPRFDTILAIVALLVVSYTTKWKIGGDRK